MNPLRLLVISFAAIGSACGSDRIHGPICTWHVDPTSTMTIQWVERLNADMPSEEWFQGPAGFGYADSDDQTPLEMQDKYQFITIRHEFELKDLPKKEEKIDLEALQFTLKIRYDDAFIAYLNGEEIARQGVKEGNGKTAVIAESHEAEAEESIPVDKKFNVLLREGKNVLAVEGHNHEIDSSDFTIDPYLVYKIGDADHTAIPKNAIWQYYLGDEVPSDWKTMSVEAREMPLVPDNHTKYEFEYTERGATNWKRVPAVPLPFADTRQILNRVLLKGLKPDTSYAFTLHEAGKSERSVDKKWFFRTAPQKIIEPLVWVAGGDMYHKRDLLDNMNRQAGRERPLFALIGGDLAYANGVDAGRWYNWIDSWSDNAVTPDDYLIPLIVAIGNHEVDVELSTVKEEDLPNFVPHERAKFFYSLFPLPEGKSNYAVDFADYMSIIILDSGHTQTPQSQVAWLDKTLAARQKVPNLFTVHHQPTYGSFTKEDDMTVREHWVPLYEKYGVDVAFENDHHVYKRSHPILKDRVDPRGVVYLGDGAWGVDVRDIPWDRLRKVDHIARADKENHLIRVRIMEDRQQFEAIRSDGRVIDSYVRFR